MLDQQYLQECLHYDSESGVFVWRIRPEEHFKNLSTQKIWNNRWAGQCAGGLRMVHDIKYRAIGIMYNVYLAHRLAWLYEYGQFPSVGLNHINGDGLDNRIANLCEVVKKANYRILTISCANKTGVTGVHMRRGRYRAQICREGKNIRLGTFDTLTEAAEIRRCAEIKYGYHPNYGVRT